MDQAQLRTELRALLYDDVAPTVWSDAALDSCVREAWAEHSYLFPWSVLIQIGLTVRSNNYTVEPLTLGYSAPTDGRPLTDLIGVQAVEYPFLTPLPYDGRAQSNPTGNRMQITGQGWYVEGDQLYLTNLPTQADVDRSALYIYATQTWIRPCDSVGALWNGPASDVELLLLLAKRQAYQLIGEWQQRNQYVTPDDPISRMTVGGVLQTLTQQINAAITFRRRRLVRSRALDI